jgi:hypothetical protein
LYEFFKGDITGKVLAKRCACAVVSGAAMFGSSLAGASLGAAIGTAICPGFGTAIGAFLGLVAGIAAGLQAGKGIDAIGDLAVDEEAEIDLMLKGQMYKKALGRLDIEEETTDE